MITPIHPTTSWNKLKSHFESTGKHINLRNEFEKDKNRFGRFSTKVELSPGHDFLLDYSKNLISDETMEILFELAKESKVDEWKRKMFSGNRINFTEDRAVLHVALRNIKEKNDSDICVEGTTENILVQVQEQLNRMGSATENIRKGVWLGFTGKTFTDVVNIGIGGSDLGPVMVCTALGNVYGKKDLNVHFVSNIDGFHLDSILSHCNPETTLFVVVSKTFTTQETMTNAESAKKWFLSKGSTSDIEKHFVAISTNDKEVAKFGIDPNNIFRFWDWTGGRYSLWSCVGFSICLTIGIDNFKELLNGAHDMDEHFLHSSDTNNLPLILALIGFWYGNCFECETQAILPYEQALSRFPAYLQQADMESNGKSRDREGNLIKYKTGQIIWGEPGTNGQHAFYQLIHQGTQLIPCDFMIGLRSPPSNCSLDLQNHHDILVANCFAQSEALAKGKTTEEVKKEHPNISDLLALHKTFQGNKPSNTIVYNELTPRALGSLIALYEHKIFVQGILWNVNSFDQWGVELGKALASVICKEIKSGMCDEKQHDCSTFNLISYYLSNK